MFRGVVVMETFQGIESPLAKEHLECFDFAFDSVGCSSRGPPCLIVSAILRTSRVQYPTYLGTVGIGKRQNGVLATWDNIADSGPPHGDRRRD